jgi:hypothetical protein
MNKALRPLRFSVDIILMLTALTTLARASIVLTDDVTPNTYGGSTTIDTVIDERHPFTIAGTLRIELDQLNVVPATLITWDTTRTKFYLDYNDYNVIQTNGITEIQVIPGGEIFNDGDQILSFDYDYLLVPEPMTLSLLALGGFLIRKQK